MSYQGEPPFRIPLGTRGLSTDDAQTRMPADALLEAQNINFYRNLCEKEMGSIRWNASPLSAGIVAFNDFWPDDASQRVIALTRDGILSKFIDRRQAVVLSAKTSTDAPSITLASDQLPCFTAGGAEQGGARKLFIFTGTTQVQVVKGDAVNRYNMSKPATDWANGYYPTAGCIHASRLTAWGNRNFPHQLYLSSALDHEDFQTVGQPLFFPVFPGEGERILGCYNFKGRLFIFKYPRGVYYLDDSDVNVANWRITKLSGVFGAASAFAFVEALDDLFVANAQGSITQLSATQSFGDITQGNLLRTLRNEAYMRQITARFGYSKRQGMWYEEKKTAYFSYQSSGGVKNDLILVIDFNDPQTPKVSWSTKDQPNCLGLMKDQQSIQRPCYGAEDGYIYRMDYPTWDVAGNAYLGSFKTINLDFGMAGASALQSPNPKIAEAEKLYDFLEISYEESGNWPLYVDVFIDNYFSETLSVQLTKRQYLDSHASPAPAPGSFLLGPTGVNQALARAVQSVRVPLHGKGRRIAFRCYNSGLRQHFRIASLAVYYRFSGQAQEA